MSVRVFFGLLLTWNYSTSFVNSNAAFSSKTNDNGSIGGMDLFDTGKENETSNAQDLMDAGLGTHGTNDSSVSDVKYNDVDVYVKSGHGNSNKTDENQNHSLTNMTEIGLLFSFLQLQVKGCVYISLCTLRHQSNYTFNHKKGETQCCHSCSCSENCVDTGNCCPDYELSKILGNVTFSDISELMESIDAANIIGLDDIMRRQYTQEYAGTYSSEECIQAHVKPVGPNVISGNNYKMIAYCPPTKSDKHTVAKCESPSHADAQLTNVIPVYSGNDVRTYKNIHCMRCHVANTTNITYWQTMLQCKSLNVRNQPYFENPNEVFKYFLNYGIASCNLVFEPEKGFKADKCTAITDDQCTFYEDYSDRDVDMLKEICKRYTLPVDVKYRGRTTFKNIACYHCSTKHNFTERCRDFHQTLPTHKYHLNSDKMIYVTDRSSFLNVTFDDSGYCKPGYILDTNKVACRQVLCPKWMFVFNRVCTPLYQRITNVAYRLLLRIEYSKELKQKRKRESSSATRDFEMDTGIALKTWLLRKTQINAFRVLLFGSQTKHGYASILFSLGHEKMTFSLVIEIVKSLLSGPTRLLTSMNRSLKIQLCSDLDITYLRYGYAIELNTKQQLFVKKELAHREKNLPSVAIPVSKANFCYRIKAYQSEIILKNGHFAVRNSTRLISSNDLEFDSKTRRPIVCITELINSNPVSSTTKPKLRLKPRDYDSSTETFLFDDEKVLSVLATMFVVLFIIIILRILLKRKDARDTS